MGPPFEVRKEEEEAREARRLQEEQEEMERKRKEQQSEAEKMKQLWLEILPEKQVPVRIWGRWKLIESGVKNPIGVAFDFVWSPYFGENIELGHYKLVYRQGAGCFWVFEYLQCSETPKCLEETCHQKLPKRWGSQSRSFWSRGSRGSPVLCFWLRQVTEMEMSQVPQVSAVQKEKTEARKLRSRRLARHRAEGQWWGWAGGSKRWMERREEEEKLRFFCYRSFWCGVRCVCVGVVENMV